MSRSTLAPGLLLVALLAPLSAHAIPAFARKTGLACSACHEVWPRLNDFGQAYRDRGYQLEQGRDAPVSLDPAYWPLAMRSMVGYQYNRQTGVPTDAGPTTAQTGAFGFGGLDVFAGGTLGKNVSFLLTIEPVLASAGFGQAPQDGDLESAFVGIHNLGGSGWANLRVGKHALDLPLDEHRILTLTQGYNLYHYHPQGSAVTFEPGENQLGLEWYGHSAQSRLRYSISLVNENGATYSGHLVSSPVVWAHVQGTAYLDNGLLASIKGGLFGSIGWHPTTYATLTPDGGGTPAPLAGTGSDLRSFRRAGAEAHLRFLSTENPLTLTGVVFFGSEDKDLIQGATGDASFLGGLAELTWTPTIHLSVTGRYEQIGNTSTGGTGGPLTQGNVTALTAAIRYTFELTSRTEVAVHLEASRATTVDATGSAPDNLTALLGLDFAF